MKKPEVIVSVSLTGEVEIEVNGVKGKGCDALTKPLEKALGTNSNKQRKPEYLQNETQAAKEFE